MVSKTEEIKLNLDLDSKKEGVKGLKNNNKERV